MRDWRQAVRLAILTVVAVAVLALTAYKTELNADRLSRFRQRDLRQQAAWELGQEVTQGLFLALKAGMTFDEIERAFGPVAELENVADSHPADASTYSLFHPKSQRTFEVEFRDGRLTRVSSNHSPSDVDTGIVLETPAYRASESVRTAVSSLSLLTWIVVLCVGIGIPRFRHNASTLLVVLSFACGLGWFLAPNYSPTLHGIASNDNLALFVFLLIGSLGFGAATRRPPDGNAPACDRFDGVALRGEARS
ncbi:MAG: hypothetical protein JW993_02540 [Sedimentisphaerales bacterium]|nr:hypothetical protein [Sedimentisphaerales bacterium]